MLKVRVVNG